MLPSRNAFISSKDVNPRTERSFSGVLYNREPSLKPITSLGMMNVTIRPRLCGQSVEEADSDECQETAWRNRCCMLNESVRLVDT